MKAIFQKNRNSISEKEQDILNGTSIAIAGLGGLGGYVASYLARIGIGKFILIDKDKFEISNLNRQIFASMEHLGKSKVEIVEKELRSINPDIEINIFNDEFDDLMLDGSCLVVDCFDNFVSRNKLEIAARTFNIPVVTGAIAGMYGYVATFMPEKKFYFYEKFSDFYNKKEIDALGSISFVCGIVSSIQACEVVKLILEKDKTLINRMLAIDLTDYSFEVFQF